MFTMKIPDLNLRIAQYNLWIVQYLTGVNWQYDLCLCTEIKSVTVAIKCNCNVYKSEHMEWVINLQQLDQI